MPAPRPGFTLVELLVALTLIAIGVAAWTGTATAALRLAADADREARATGEAQTLAALGALSACVVAGTGESHSGEPSVIRTGIATRIVAARLYVTRTGTRTAVAERLVLCE